jgi:hypothetical protein
LNSFINLHLIFRVRGTCGLVQNQDGCIFQNCAGNRNPLLFSAGEAGAEGLKEGIARAKKAEAKAALLGAGVNPARVVKAVGLLELDDLDLDDDGLDGVDDAIEDLRKEWPELFAKKRVKRDSVAGERDRDGERESRRGKAKTASELAAAKLLGRG